MVYILIDRWEHYGTGGVNIFTYEKEKDFKDFIKKHFKSVDKFKSCLKEKKITIVKGEIVKPKITETEIIKEIEL